tara:strand:+ start:197 stop:2770 length:2574 start_codon:yes stop_codon:yes gene_type:complete
VSNSSLNENVLNKTYKPLEIEKKWQLIWKTKKIYKTIEVDSDKEKFYALSMFPYPSGNLHMGHVRNYVITDLIARYQALQGKEVLHPMGWDAFGLPAENAAIERGVNPSSWTQKNIIHMKSQLELLGLSVDWEKEFATCDEGYYKWTQFIFLELYKEGLVYQNKSEVNWDPVDRTVLANEQVDSEGKSWRSGAKVEKKLLKQWYLKITSYADELLNDLEKLKDWPERVKIMQENWIGKSIGSNINFKIKKIPDIEIKVFTTRADTLYGVTYLAISFNHELLKHIKNKNLIEKILNFKNNKLRDNYDEQNKFGIDSGLIAINPVNNEEIPIWFANYVIDGYGTGAVMGVPAHDQRDFEFAKLNSIKIKKVISRDKLFENNKLEKAYEESGYLLNSDEFNGLPSSKARESISKLGIKKGWAENNIEFRLRDWLISRQRYWGCPIPMVICKSCGPVPVDLNDLPVKLPKEISIKSNKINSLADNKEWININCPKCSAPSKRETDTMDTFMCSSWYFLRYPTAKNNLEPFNKDKVNKWLPVNQYVGGVEHAILHLLYARFLTKALRDRGLFDIDEPFNKLLTQGMVQAAAFKNTKTGKYVPPSKINNVDDPLDPDDNSKLEKTFEKMSKSKYNGIDPQIVIDKYGADTARMFILFKAPPEKDLEWGDSDVEGQFRFLSRIWKLYYEYSINKTFNKEKITEKDQKFIERSMNLAIQEITNDIENNQFNTAISELMKFYNSITNHIHHVEPKLRKEVLTNFCLLLAPFAPHISEELWTLLGFSDSVHKSLWPEINQKALIKNNYELVIQVNGRVRDKVIISTGSTEEDIKKISLERSNIKKWTNKKDIKKIIVVKGRIINIVV